MKNKKAEELQSRREFFKKAAKAALPVVGAVVLSSLPIAQAEAATQYCVCSYNCQGSCSGDCQFSCKNGCNDSCFGSCRNTCNARAVY